MLADVQKKEDLIKQINRARKNLEKRKVELGVSTMNKKDESKDLKSKV